MKKSITTLLICSSVCLSGVAQAERINGMGALLPTIENEANTPPLGFSVPGRVDLRRWTVPIGDQGSTNSCVAWTIAYAMLGWYAKRNQVSDYTYAPMYMYSQINVGRSQGFDGGAYPSEAFKLAINQGNALQAIYSRPNPNDWLRQPTESDKVDAAFHTIKSYTNLFSNSSGEGGGLNGQYAIVHTLASMNPVAISLRVRPGFERLSPTVATHDDIQGPVSGYHEILAVGYDERGIIVQNHWGKNWGNNGFGHLSWSVVQNDVFNADSMVPNDTAYNTVYRFYIPATSQHLYTLSYAEGYQPGNLFKGVEWRGMTQGGKNRRALYRCLINGTQNTRFVSTDSACERQINEGTYGYVFDTQVEGTVPLYRYYHRTTGERLTTANPVEADKRHHRLEVVLGYVTI